LRPTNAKVGVTESLKEFAIPHKMISGDKKLITVGRCDDHYAAPPGQILYNMFSVCQSCSVHDPVVGSSFRALKN
jgi:hypothetical protein